MHTTNGCESYHLRLNRRFYCPHPNIFTTNTVGDACKITKLKRRKKKSTLNKIKNLREQITKYTNNITADYVY